MHVRTVLSLAVALALALSLSPTLAAPEDPLTIVANGVQIVTSDIIIDIGQSDIVYTIPRRNDTPRPPVTSPVVPPVRPRDRSSENDGVGEPVVDLTPRQLPTRAATIAQENARRRQAFAAREAGRPRVITEADLPPLRVLYTEELARKISRGTSFPVQGTSLGIMPSAERAEFLAREVEADLRNHTLTMLSAVQKEVYERTGGLGPDFAVPLIVVRNPSRTPSVEGDSYGRMISTTMSIRELYETFRNDRESIALVAYDVPLSVAAVESDGVISGPPARSLTGATGAVGVCLVDTGVDTAVPAVASAFVGGYDFIEDDTTPQDVHGHGTLMADAILTVAPGAQLYVAKVLNNSGDGFASDVIKGIDWCMTQDVSVISLSLGGGDFAGWCDASVLAMKANEAAARGFAVVAAAGNDGPTQMDSPACGSSVLSVAGTTKNDTVWSSSALTSVTDVFAPSVAVSLTGIGGEERIASGTSAGAAFTAGAVAVLLENEPLTSNEVVDRFRSTGVLIGTAVGDVPRINLLAAVTNATTGFDPTQTGGYVEGDIGYVSASICIDEGSGCFSDPECTQSHCSGSQAGEPCNFNGCFTTCSYTNELGSGGNCGQLCNSYCTVTGSFAQCESAPAGTEGNDCSICQECDGAGSCVNIASGTSDNGGSDLCRATAVGCEFGTCQCDGSGNCDIATGSQCSFGSQCVSGTCKDNVYQGSVTTDRCVGDNSWCVGTSNSYASGTTVGDSVCRGSVSGGSVWLASSGRYEVRNTTGSVLAVLDKYGSFGIRGSPTWSTGSFDNGWQVQDSGAVTRFSINSANGNLRAASTLTTRTTPSGTGFRVQNTTGSLQGIITTAGAVALRGDFAYSLTTLS